LVGSLPFTKLNSDPGYKVQYSHHFLIFASLSLFYPSTLAPHYERLAIYTTTTTTTTTTTINDERKVTLSISP
jgi:hypothetical protein